MTEEERPDEQRPGEVGPSPSKVPDPILDHNGNPDWMAEMRRQREAEGMPKLGSLSDVAHEVGSSIKDYNRRYKGTGSWFALIIVFISMALAWNGGDFNFIGFLIVFSLLSLITAPFRLIRWASRRANSRPCPVCGMRVQNGETECGSCGTDFRLR